jgi:nitrogen regulatory protein PII
METFPKTRIEITIEAPILSRVTQTLDAFPISGYSVLPVISGRGHDGSWSIAGQISDAGRMLMIICIVDPSKAEAILQAIFPIVQGQIGIVTTSDVRVIRQDAF